MGRLRPILAAACLAAATPASGTPLDRWAPHISEAAARFGVPEAWIRRLIAAESGGRTMFEGRPITSRAGAMGLMQLMPETWKETRRHLRLGTDPHDPRDNILAGTFYLKMMYERFGYPGLFAAYNAGPARYARHVARGERLPGETIAYVAAVTGSENIGVPTARMRRDIFVVRRADGDEGIGAVAVTGEARSEGLFVSLSTVSTPRY
ncbi:lytic transglycosylase domain-containing protein [Allosphingosinicella deserti]|uniref:Lytic transglycosylase domain-containing protein n=1 Tax=Allosphingosinicella deserti TaxID=2116704 RepID=A0A2P7QE36_9SPHN|nr:lytic transglycosylase domain-containing protein [Sphingomonas deserti]